MQTLFNTALPIFAIILCGYLAGRFKVLGEHSADALNKFVYFFALPCLLFGFTARAPVGELLNWPFIFAYLSASVVTYALGHATGRLAFGLRQPELGLHALAAVFANTAYLGIPLFLAAFGEDRAGPAIVATIAANTVFIALAIAVLEFFGSGAQGGAGAARQIARMVATNPLVVAPIIALPLALTGTQLPVPVANFVNLLGATAGPAALFALGMSFVGRQFELGRGEIGVLLAVKLILHPLIAWALVAWVFDLDPYWSWSVIALSALPVGALVFVIAQQYQVYVVRASTAVIASTVLSIVTISWLLTLAPQ